MFLQSKIFELSDKLKDQTIKTRRDLHKHPESAFTEFRTASIVAQKLTKLGYDVLYGEQANKEEAMMGVPKAKELEQHMQRAIAQGADAAWVQKMQGGKTGLVGIMKFNKPGPTVGLRFDMDCNDVVETEDGKHKPNKEGFASLNKNCMHACGHDGHTAVGLSVAQIIAGLKDELSGTVKLVFQPGEEGVRGAKAMMEQGVVDDVDFMLGAHFGFKANKTGDFACNIKGFLATSKYDAEFTGLPAHAGAAPEQGKNALLASACAALNLHAISRHSDGVSRINVGVLNAGTGRNVLPANAVLKLETRGGTSKINQYVVDEAKRMIEASALMYDVKVKMTEMGGAAGGNNSPALSEQLAGIAEKLGVFDTIIPEVDFGASEDFSYFMERVQEKGGQAAYMMIGADLAAGHHDSKFDFDENALDLATKMLTVATVELLQEKSND